MNENKQASCPTGCGAAFQWSWEQDTYAVVGGKSSPSSLLTSVQILKEGEEEVAIWRCPNCKKIIGFSVLDIDGLFVFNHPAWEGVDWLKAAFN